MVEVKRLFDIPYYQVKKYNTEVVFVTKYDGNWKSITAKKYVNDFNCVSRALLDLGVRPNDKIGIITNRTRVEWNIADMGLMQIGAQSIPVYDSTSANDMEYIFNHSEIKYCIVATKEIYDKVNSIKSNIKTLKEIITFDQVEGCKSIADLIKIGGNLSNDDEVKKIKDSIKSEDLVTIIYTSGTTDKPKGVMLNHINILSSVFACEMAFPRLKEERKGLSFLPVSHIFERTLLYIYQYTGYSVYYAESIDTIGADIAIVKPHVMSCVPRLLEKIYDKIMAKGNELKGLKKRLFNWALELGYKYEADEKNGSKYERNLSRARKLVFSKWRAALGGNIISIFCGSAKLRPELARVFNAAGITVLDGYGLTETSPVISANFKLPNRNKMESIGKPVKGVEVKITEEGEITAKGANIMMGYYKDPERTKKAIINGYFHTGDLGRLDEEGFLYITGRKKENFKTSGGKYINPGKIEIQLKKSGLVEQAMVIGEGEKMPAAILQPNFELLRQKIGNISNEDLIKNDTVLSDVQKVVDAVNTNLGQWEKIKRFELTPDEWTIEAGHLTPTLKVKRDIIKTKYYILYNKIYRPFFD